MLATPSFDAIVVGSGASGGWACKRLAEAGLKVALLEAGRPQSPENFTEHMPAFQLKYRDRAPEIMRKTRPIQSIFEVCTEYNYDWFCNDLDEPYTTPADKPFQWIGRMRMTGGRTNVWGRVCLRFSDFDLKAADQDGYGPNWPFCYKDLEPYYDLVEDYVGVTGLAEGLELLTQASTDKAAVAPVPPTLRDRFEHLKGWIVGAYYSSEIGMRELGWTGNVFFASFPGCEHPGGHS